MKVYFGVIILMILATTQLNAQKPGDVIVAVFNGEQLYYARVISSDKDFIEVTFVHSNSYYKFTRGSVSTISKKINMGKVVSTVGGKFGPGSKIGYQLIGRTEELTPSSPCNNTVVIIEFEDGKQFLAEYEVKEDKTYEFEISHSKKLYTIDMDTKKITTSNGAYNVGRSVNSIYCTDFEEMDSEDL